jgi:hypothetical protein
LVYELRGFESGGRIHYTRDAFDKKKERPPNKGCAKKATEKRGPKGKKSWVTIIFYHSTLAAVSFGI